MGHPFRLEAPLEAVGLRSEIDVHSREVQEAGPGLDSLVVQARRARPLREDVPRDRRGGQGGPASDDDPARVLCREVADPRARRSRVGEDRVVAGGTEAGLGERRRGRSCSPRDGEPERREGRIRPGDGEGVVQAQVRCEGLEGEGCGDRERGRWGWREEEEEELGEQRREEEE